MHHTVHIFQILGTKQWTFGQKLIVDDKIYWSTDSQYQCFGSTRRAKRRDCFSLIALENVRVRNSDGSVSQKRTRLCCESVCFFTITGLTSNQPPMDETPRIVIPENLRGAFDTQNDRLTFVLGRFFSPHPLAVDRDSLHRPVCPGPLKLNHCLWTYAKSSSDRKILVKPNGRPTTYFENQRHIFGTTENRQLCLFEQEKDAYLCIHTPDEIYRRAQMTQEYCGDTLTHSDTWLESIVTK